MSNKKRRLTAGVLLAAMLVTWIGPLQAFAGSEVCGLKEHTHSEACYRTEEGTKELTCTLSSILHHQHDSSCHLVNGEWSCGYASYVVHTHDQNCYLNGKLVCTLPEYQVHQHDVSCYSSSLVLTCKEEENLGHTHDDGCYMTTQVLSCFEPEGSGHVHDYFCQDQVLVCWENHEHTMDCYETQIVCGIEEGSGHVHTDDCYTTQRTLACGLKEEPAGHVHLQSCYSTQQTLTCGAGEEALHTHTASCYSGDTLICGKQELLQHQHTEACFSGSEGTSTLICTLPEHTHTASCYEQQVQTTTNLLQASASGTQIKAVVPDGALPDGTELIAETLSEKDSGYSAVQQSLDDAEVDYDGFSVFDIRFELDGEEVEPSKPVRITIDTSSVIPSSADPDSVAIHHLVEPRTMFFGLLSAGTSLEQVADADDMTLTKGPSWYQMSASFEVDSFSYFTVTWVEKGKTLNLHCVDSEGNMLTDDVVPINVWEFSSTGDSTNRIGNILISYLAEEIIDILDITYPYDHAYVYSGGEKVEVKRISYNDETTDGSGNVWPGWIYSDGSYHRWLAEDGSDLGTVDEADIYLVFYTGAWSPDPIEQPINKDIHVTMYDFGSVVNSVDGAVLDFFSSPSGGATDTHAQIDGEDPEGSTHGGGTRPTMSRLLSGGYPYIESITTSSKSYEGGSLEYLFHDNAASEYVYPMTYSFDSTNGYTTDYVSRRYTMSGDGGLFHRDAETGYYSYDCSENAAFFNGDRFVLYDALIAPGFCSGLTVSETKNAKFWYNFFPFNKPVYNTNTQEPVAHPVQTDKEVYFTGYNSDLTENPEVTNNWFGMKMDFRFMMPQNGQMNGQDMEFYFCGDDDVWVYIDGVLVLDIGGTHGASAASINFATGDIYSIGTGSTTIRAMYELAYEELVADGSIDSSSVSLTQYLAANGIEGDNLTFSNYTSHELDFFYMERGGNISYCELEFNIPVLHDHSISITKGITTLPEGFDTYGDPYYEFQVLHAEADGTPTEELFLPAGTPYSVYDLNGNLLDDTQVTDEYGIVKLKQGQMAVIDNILENAGLYYCREILEPGLAGQYAYVEIDGVLYTFSEDVLLNEEPFYGASSPSTDIADGSADFVFTNQVKLLELGSFHLTKEVDSNSLDDYSLGYDIYLTFDGTPIEEGASFTRNGETETVDSAGHITIYDGDVLLFERLLIGTEINVSEDFSDIEGEPFTVTYSGTGVSSQEGSDGVVVGSVTVQDKNLVEMVVTNSRAVGRAMLPKSGGPGQVYAAAGAVLISLGGILLLLKKKRKISSFRP